MPDMSKPGTHIQQTYEAFKFKAAELRRKAAMLTTEADTYEEASYALRDAIDKEAAKKPAPSAFDQSSTGDLK